MSETDKNEPLKKGGIYNPRPPPVQPRDNLQGFGCGKLNSQCFTLLIDESDMKYLIFFHGVGRNEENHPGESGLG